jgi:hypothetical protein
MASVERGGVMTSEDGRGDNRGKPLPVLLSALVLILAALAISACGDDEEQAADEGQGAGAQTAQPLTVSEVLARAERSQGQKVTVRAAVLQAFQPGVLTLADSSAAVGEPEDVEERLPLLLTEGAQPPGALSAGSVVRAEGTIERMGDELLAREEFPFEETDRKGEILEEFADTPVVVATSAEIEGPPQSEE